MNKTDQTTQKIIKNLTPAELFDLGWFFKNAVIAAQSSSGVMEREFARCLSAYTGNENIDKILSHVACKIKLGEEHPFVLAKTELYNLLE